MSDTICNFSIGRIFRLKSFSLVYAKLAFSRGSSRAPQRFITSTLTPKLTKKEPAGFCCSSWLGIAVKLESLLRKGTVIRMLMQKV